MQAGGEQTFEVRAQFARRALTQHLPHCRALRCCILCSVLLVLRCLLVISCQYTCGRRHVLHRYALTQTPAVLSGPGRFNVTEIHCTEYYPGTQGGEAKLVL